MEGTISITVNLRSPSVEYSREVGADRFSHVLRGDDMSAKDMVALGGFDDMPFDDDKAKLKYIIGEMEKMVQDLSNLEFLTIERCGSKVTIHPDDISFITIKKTGVFLEL